VYRAYISVGGVSCIYQCRWCLVHISVEVVHHAYISVGGASCIYRCRPIKHTPSVYRRRCRYRCRSVYREHIFLSSRTSVLLTAHQAYRHAERHRNRSVYRYSRYPVGTIPRDIGEPIDREYRSRPRVPSRPGHVTYHVPLIATMSPRFSSGPPESPGLDHDHVGAPVLIMPPCF
jgi:hypothetical protein